MAGRISEEEEEILLREQREWYIQNELKVIDDLIEQKEQNDEHFDIINYSWLPNGELAVTLDTWGDENDVVRIDFPKEYPVDPPVFSSDKFFIKYTPHERDFYLSSLLLNLAREIYLLKFYGQTKRENMLFEISSNFPSGRAQIIRALQMTKGDVEAAARLLSF